MLIDSNLLQELERNAFSPTGQPMSIYGDPAYPLRIHLQAPYCHGVLTPMMEQYNFDMSSGSLGISSTTSSFWILRKTLKLE